MPVSSWMLPADLGASGLLAGLSTARFATALTEAMHAGHSPGDARADRAVYTARAGATPKRARQRHHPGPVWPPRYAQSAIATFEGCSMRLCRRRSRRRCSRSAIAAGRTYILGR